MSRVPLVGFGVLVVATIAAFFVSQHLKVTTPLITGPLGGLPTYGRSPHHIVPGNPRCGSVTLYFQLLHHADSFDLGIVDDRDRIVRTLASDVPAQIKRPFQFSWDGRFDDGSIAPRGLYNFRLHLIHQNRTIDPVIYGYPVRVQSTCPP